MLAVSLYPLERVLPLRESFRAHGLLDPANLAKWSVDHVAATLSRAGYNRGRLGGIYADRLVSLGKQATTDRGAYERVLLHGGEEEIRELLMPWHGIGPTVLGHFFTLRQKWPSLRHGK